MFLRSRPSRGYLLLSACLVLLATESAWAAGNTTVSVGATVLSKSNCRFTAPATATLDFGNLDPANPVDVPRTATLTVRCAGSAANATYLITDDDGLHGSGGTQRMQHATTLTEYIPYAFSYAPASGTIPKNTNQTITISGTVAGVDYENALLGSYADTVTLTIAP